MKQAIHTQSDKRDGSYSHLSSNQQSKGISYCDFLGVELSDFFEVPENLADFPMNSQMPLDGFDSFRIEYWQIA